MSLFSSIWNGVKGVGKAVGGFFGIGSGGNANLSGALGALGSTALNIGTSALTYKQSKDLANQQAKLNYDYNIKQMNAANNLQLKNNLRQYSDEVTALKQAGLNPLLGLGGDTGAQSVSSTTGNFADYSNVMSNAMNAATNFQNLRNLRAQEGLTTAQTQQSGMQTMLTNKQASFIDAQSKGQEIDNLFKADDYYSNFALRESMVQSNNASAQLDLFRSIGQDLENKFMPKQQRAMLENLMSSTFYNIKSANAAYSNAQANLSQAGTARQYFAMYNDLNRAELDWQRKHPKQASFLRGVGQYTSAFGLNAGNISIPNIQAPKRPVGFH